MKPFLSAGLALAFAFPLTLHAQQTDRVVGGFTPVIFNQQFLSQISAFGIAVTDLAENPLQNGTNVLPTVQGAIDLQTGATDVSSKGGYEFRSQGLTVRLEDFTLQASQANSSISGLVVVNGRFLGRQTVFIVNQNPNLPIPLPVTNGTLQLPPLSLGFAPAFASAVNQLLGKQIFNPAVQIATEAPTAIVVPDTPANPE